MKCRHGNEHQIVAPSGSLTRYLVPYQLSPARIMLGTLLRWAWGITTLFCLVSPFILFLVTIDPGSNEQLKWATLILFLVFGLAFWQFLVTHSKYPKHVGYMSIEPDDMLTKYNVSVKKEKGSEVYRVTIGRQTIDGIDDIEPFNTLLQLLKNNLKE